MKKFHLKSEQKTGYSHVLKAVGGLENFPKERTVGTDQNRLDVGVKRQIVGEIMTTIGFSLGGGTAGSSILPGLAAGVGADWVLNKFREGMSREDFEKQNLQAVNATIKTWKSKISTSLKTSADQWFDESKRAISE